MDIQPQPVGSGVHIVVAVGGAVHYVVHGAGHYIQVNQPLHQAPGDGFMHIVKAGAGLDGGNARLLGGQHQVVDFPLGRREPAGHRPGAGDIGGVVAVFGAGVNEQQVVIAQGVLVADVMEGAGVGAAGDDGRVAVAGGTELPEGAFQGGLHFVFGNAGGGGAHGGVKAPGGDVDGALQEGDFVVGLDLAHQVNLPGGIFQAAHPFGAALGLAAALLDDAGDDGVQAGIAAEGVMDGFAVGQQAGQLGIQAGERVGGVGAQRPDGAAHPGPAPDPDFKVGVVGADEQGVGSAGAGAQDGHGVRFVKAGEVPEG